MINHSYLESSTLSELSSHFNSDPEFRTLSLAQFLDPEFYSILQKELKNTIFERDNRPIMYRRETAEPGTEILSLLSNSDFGTILNQILGHDFSIEKSTLMRYGVSDYQILHDNLVESPGVDVIIDLTDDWNDDFGGYVVYTDGDGEFLTLSQKGRMLSIVDRGTSYHRFVKYVNHYAENRWRTFLILTLKVEI
jgi:hypothetical protein